MSRGTGIICIRALRRAWCIVSAAAILATPALAQEAGTIRGTITSATAGAPVANADVFLEGSGRRALSNRAGGFVFLGLPAGGYTIVVEHVGYGTARQQVEVAVGRPVQVSVVLEDEAISIPEVVVIASRDAKNLSEVAASVGVIGGSTIREAQPGHPSEIMGQVPGVWVNVTGGEGHMTAIRQPLSTAPLYLYLEDGVPTRSTGFFNHNALYEVNLPQADRIEIMKGPANAMYGSDALGGVINVGTRAPTETTRGELSVEGGESGWQRYLGSLSGRSGANGFRADANVTLTDGWREGTDYARYSGTLRWDRTMGSGASWRTVATYSNIDQSTAGTSAISRADFESDPTINYTPISFRKVTALRMYSVFERQDGPWSWSATGFARSNTMDLLPNWSLTFDPALWETENRSVGLLAKVRRQVASGRGSVTAGFDVDYSPGGRVEHAIAPDAVDGIFVDYTMGAPIYDYDVTFRGVSPYLHAEATPSDRLHLSAGLRLDLLGYDYRNALSVEATGQHRRPADATPTFQALSPKVGVTFEATRALDLFASYRRGFRAPSEGQLFRQGSAENTIDLEPVKADSWELGLRGSAGPSVRYEVSTYWMTKKDDILSFRLPDGSTQATNAGETLHKGVELGLGVRVVRGVDLEAAYSVAEHTYEEWRPNTATEFSGNEQEFAPREIGNVRLRLAPAFAPAALATLEWSRLGPYWEDASNENEYEGHHLLNLRFSYDVTHRIQLFGRLNNVLDERYAERASYNAFRGEELAPGMPRTFYLGARVR